MICTWPCGGGTDGLEFLLTSFLSNTYEKTLLLSLAIDGLLIGLLLSMTYFDLEGGACCMTAN